MNQANDNPHGSGADRQADERLINALLVHLHDDRAADHRERRVARVMLAVRGSGDGGSAIATAPAARSRRLRIWAACSAWAAAAVVLIGLGLHLFGPHQKSALASLNDILSALGRPGDRTYRIQMEDLPAPSEPRPPGDRPPDDHPSGDRPPEGSPPNDRPPPPRPLDNRPSENAPRPGLDGATLYLRDGQQYLLVRKDPNGGELYDGYDGRQSWRVRRGELAETKKGLGAGGIPMPPIMANVPFADLRQTLEQIRVDYTVEQLDQAPLASGGDMLRHVLVRRKSREIRGPDTIEIWANPETGMPKRIVFDDAKVQGNLAPCRVTLDLCSEEGLSPSWFMPAPHISDGRGEGR